MDEEQPIGNEDESPEDSENPEHTEDQEESFAELFESYSHGMNEDLQVGDKVHGKIISISDTAVFIDTGSKADGVVEIDELLDKEGNLPHAVGDELDLYVVSRDESEIRLSRAIAGIGGLGMLKDAYGGKIPVEGKVVQVIKGGFQVEVLKRRAFCPISQIDVQFVEKPEDYVGQNFQFLIKKLAENGRNIVLSRRELLAAEQQKAHEAFLKDLAADQIYTGRVTRIMPYGAFVELIPGLEGMVHISELSWSRLEKPGDAVSPNDRISVKVLRIDAGPKGPKIALSVKQAEGDPWQRMPDDVRAGGKIQGKVTRCTNFGAFVEIKPGIEGLVHISELSYTQRVHRVEDIVRPGQTVTVVIKEIDLDKRRISLSLRDAQGDPWADITDKYQPEQAVTGVVEKVEKFGVFIQLAPGIVGLLPQSVIQSTGTVSMDRLKAGQALDVVIGQVNAAERKISLKLGQGESPEAWQSYAEDSSNGTRLGSLAEKLTRALNGKKDE